MKKVKGISIVVCLLAVLFLVSSAHATLELRGTDSLGNRLIYDTDLNITWYDYTKSWDTWQNQNDWASNLTVNFSGTIYDDWRLPSTVGGAFSWGCDETTTAGYNITSSEMGHLFYVELGNKGKNDISCNTQAGWGLSNKGPFIKLKRYLYWSGTAAYGAGGGDAWDFDFGYGGQYTDEDDFRSPGGDPYAIAVRPGDVPQQPADLVITSLGNPPKKKKRESTFTVKYTVKNQGFWDAGQFTNDFYLSADKVKSEDDIYLNDERSISSLGIGMNSGKKTVTVTIPSDTPTGKYYVIACVDKFNEIEESDDTNNCKASKKTITVVTVSSLCPDISGSWFADECATITCSGAFGNGTDEQCGSGYIYITQHGCNINFSSPANTSRKGTVKGNKIQFSGKLALSSPGVDFSENLITFSGTISPDLNSISVTGSGKVSGAYQGSSGSCSATSEETFTK